MIRAFYQSIGADGEAMLRRFGSEALVKKYLAKLLQDNTFSTLATAMQRRDYHEAFRAAHTLKGIALNLELTQLAEKSSVLTELLRDNVKNEEAADAAYQDVAACYAAITAQLQRILA